MRLTIFSYRDGEHHISNTREESDFQTLNIKYYFIPHQKNNVETSTMANWLHVLPAHSRNRKSTARVNRTCRQSELRFIENMYQNPCDQTK